MTDTETQDIYRRYYTFNGAMEQLRDACTRLRRAVLADMKRVIIAICLLFV